MIPLNLVKLVIIFVATFVIVSGLFNIHPLGEPRSEDDLIRVLQAQRVTASIPGELSDLDVFHVNVPGCGEYAVLYIASFARKAAFNRYIGFLPGNVFRIYLGRQVTSFQGSDVFFLYLEHQLASKLGLSPDTLWSQKLVAYQISTLCQGASLASDDEGLAPPLIQTRR